MSKNPERGFEWLDANTALHLASGIAVHKLPGHANRTGGWFIVRPAEMDGDAYSVEHRVDKISNCHGNPYTGMRMVRDEWKARKRHAKESRPTLTLVAA